MRKGFHPRRQGDLGEISAMEWLACAGGRVYLPIGHSPDVDLIAEFGGGLLRVQVKTSTCRNDRGGWEVMLATRGGNQSWTGLVKYFDSAKCDFLFVHVGDGRRWFIPAGEIESRTGVSLGGLKYSEFEIEPGRPLSSVSALESKSARGSAGAGEPGRPVKSVATPEWVRFPPPPSQWLLASKDAGTLTPNAAFRAKRKQDALAVQEELGTRGCPRNLRPGFMFPVERHMSPPA